MKLDQEPSRDKAVPGHSGPGDVLKDCPVIVASSGGGLETAPFEIFLRSLWLQKVRNVKPTLDSENCSTSRPELLLRYNENSWLLAEALCVEAQHTQ